ncbi:serine hydrolase domain-containing protein [Microbacterium dauci]|uniref:Serine hydrolase n=1 Tax=Microbacterium dauci TaxID=3048008 RepID=A0ABT6ZD97_9MICO|nr:serine hydrolase [Microbacterium sp. LX3-4]MDJ1114124.1 serine hydrolase [Microbacterium sp. LX3-4]
MAERAAEILTRFVDAVDAAGIAAHGVHVRAAGEVAEHRWTRDVREDVQSVAKGVCALAAAIAVDEGLIELDAPVSRYLPDLTPPDSPLTLLHLLTLTSGVDYPWSPTMFEDSPDVAAEFLSRPAPERAFQYSNASTYTAMRALATVTGDLVDWLTPRLFAPLGIDDVEWERCPLGHVLAGGGLRLRTEELARIALLIRDRGLWDGHRLVSAAGVDTLHTGWVASGTTPGYERYALAGWDGPGDGWRLHGAFGQVVVFSGDVVLTVTADDFEGGFQLPDLAFAAIAS